MPRLTEDVDRLPVCVSVAGINFAYSPQDRAEFTENGLILEDKALARMRQISHLILQSMAREHRAGVP